MKFCIVPGLTTLLAGALSLLAGTASADVDNLTLVACVQQHAAKETNPAVCVNEALQDCLSVPADSPSVASVCFRDANQAFADGIAQRMAQLQAAAPENIAAIAGIEVKYDLLSGMTQCDRLAELALIGNGAMQDIQRSKDQCATIATGMAHVRLLWRSQDLQ